MSTENFDIKVNEDVSGQFRYERARSALEFDLKHVSGAGGSLHFNNIGESDPVDFISSLDWGYVKGKIYGHGGREPDFLKTITAIHRQVTDPNDDGLDLSEVEIDEVLKTLRATMVFYDGEDLPACEGLASALRRQGIDDAHHFVEFRETEEARFFREQIWEPTKEALLDYLEDEVGTPFNPIETEEALDDDMEFAL
jgi:hypothetical protein